MMFRKVNVLNLYGVLVAILFISVYVYAESVEEDKNPEDDINDVEDDFASDILKPLGPLKNSRVLRTTYFLSRIETDWFSARQHCFDHKLRLLSIEDLEEDTEIVDFLNDERVLRVWTSGNDLNRNGQFVWSSTQRHMVYTNWHRVGVSRDSRKNCVFTGTNRYWGDGTYGWDEEYCANRMRFICEESL